MHWSQFLRGKTRERKQLTEHRSSVERLSPLILPSLSSSALQHAVKPQLGSCWAPKRRRQGFAAVQIVSKFAGESCMRVDHSAERHAATLIHCLPLGSNMVISCPLPEPYFHGGVSKRHCQHVMSLPGVQRNKGCCLQKKCKHLFIERLAKILMIDR